MPIKYFIWYVIVAGWQETSPYIKALSKDIWDAALFFYSTEM